MDPRFIARGVQSQYQPLSQAYLAAVNRNINANLGMRGLGVGSQGTLAAGRAFAEQENFRRELASRQYMQSLQSVVGQGGNIAGIGGNIVGQGQNASQFPNVQPVQANTFGFES